MQNPFQLCHMSPEYRTYPSEESVPQLQILVPPAPWIQVNFNFRGAFNMALEAWRLWDFPTLELKIGRGVVHCWSTEGGPLLVHWGWSTGPGWSGLQRVGGEGWSRDVWTASKPTEANNRERLNRGILISPGSASVSLSSIGERLNIALFSTSTGCTRKTGGGREGSNRRTENKEKNTENLYIIDALA